MLLVPSLFLGCLLWWEGIGWMSVRTRVEEGEGVVGLESQFCHGQSREARALEGQGVSPVIDFPSEWVRKTERDRER